jgi:putative hydrolase of the HAD superfamily
MAGKGAGKRITHEQAAEKVFAACFPLCILPRKRERTKGRKPVLSQGAETFFSVNRFFRTLLEMGRVKAVFFDAAGTLFETREPVGASYARIARRYSVDASAEDINAAFRRTFHSAGALAFGPGRSPAELRRLERQWWRELVAETFAGLGQFTDFEAYFEELFGFFAEPANWVADGEAAATLSTLRERGFVLGVISNFDFRLYRILDGLRLSLWFDSVTISSEAGFAKPSAKLFEAALERHQLAAHEAIHVGDSEHLDVAGAAAAGLKPVLIDRKLSERIAMANGAARISSLAATIEVAGLFE